MNKAEKSSDETLLLLPKEITLGDETGNESGEFGLLGHLHAFVIWSSSWSKPSERSKSGWEGNFARVWHLEAWCSVNPKGLGPGVVQEELRRFRQRRSGAGTASRWRNLSVAISKSIKSRMKVALGSPKSRSPT